MADLYSINQHLKSHISIHETHLVLIQIIVLIGGKSKNPKNMKFSVKIRFSGSQRSIMGFKCNIRHRLFTIVLFLPRQSTPIRQLVIQPVYISEIKYMNYCRQNKHQVFTWYLSKTKTLRMLLQILWLKPTSQIDKK